jgi:hypothetical protein
MKIVGSISRSMSYGFATIDHAITKMTHTPSNVRKLLQLINNIFSAIDASYQGQAPERQVTKHLAGAAETLAFYGTYVNLRFWLNLVLFSKKNMDEKVLQTTLENSISQIDSLKDEKENLTKTIFTQVMAENAYYSQDEVRNVIKKATKEQLDQLITNQRFEHTSVDEAEETANQVARAEEIAELITKQVTIQRKACPLTERVSMACFTIASIGSNILTLQKWEVLSLAKLATSIGSQSRAFMFVFNLGGAVILGTFTIAGTLVNIGEASYRATRKSIKYYRLIKAVDKDPEKQQKVYLKIRKALTDILVGGIDLVSTIAPLAFTLNPLTLAGLAIFAKGTSVICVLAR